MILCSSILFLDNFLDDLTSCCKENKVPDSCLGHCVVDYSNGYRKLTADDEKTMKMGLCKDHSDVIKECQKRGEPYCAISVRLVGEFLILFE